MGMPGSGGDGLVQPTFTGVELSCMSAEDGCSTCLWRRILVAEGESNLGCSPVGTGRETVLVAIAPEVGDDTPVRGIVVPTCTIQQRPGVRKGYRRARGECEDVPLLKRNPPLAYPAYPNVFRVYREDGNAEQFEICFLLC